MLVPVHWPLPSGPAAAVPASRGSLEASRFKHRWHAVSLMSACPEVRQDTAYVLAFMCSARDICLHVSYTGHEFIFFKLLLCIRLNSVSCEARADKGINFCEDCSTNMETNWSVTWAQPSLGTALQKDQQILYLAY